MMSSTATPTTVRQAIEHCQQAMTAADLHFGHGTDNARDEACWLVAYALGLPLDFGTDVLDRPVNPEQRGRVRELLERRVRSRMPMAYLTGEAWFAGLPFKVTPDVLIPRSPLAEFIEQGFAPWVDVEKCRAVADVGTGSGGLAVACAWHYPHLEVDALDISPAALKIARENVGRHGLEARVRVLESDLLGAVSGKRYDVILSNPPYVPRRSMETLPAEHRHEPVAALEAADDGLEPVLRLLRQAPAHLNPGGILVVEVGEARTALEARLPSTPFVWLEFAHGEDGVFVLDAAACGAIE